MGAQVAAYVCGKQCACAARPQLRMARVAHRLGVARAAEHLLIEITCQMQILYNCDATRRPLRCVSLQCVLRSERNPLQI